MALRIYLRMFGVLLLFGGFGHVIGIIRLCITQGVPDANRVLLDVWVAEAQLLGGGLYVAASMALKSGAKWRALALFGALTVIGYAAAFIPVVFYRAPWPFRLPPTVYTFASLVVLIVVMRKTPDTET